MSSIHPHGCIQVHVCVCGCVHVCMCVYWCMHVCVCLWFYVCMLLCMYIDQSCIIVVTQLKYNRAKALLNYLPNLKPNEVSSFFQQLSDVCLLPVLSSPRLALNTTTESYPQGLLWKGKLCACHFTSLGSHVFVPMHATAECPLIFGSKVYVVNYMLPTSIPSGVIPSITSYVP